MNIFKKVGGFVANVGAAIGAMVFGSSSAQALDTAAVITELTGAASSVDSVILALLAILTSLLVFAMVRKAMGK